MAVAALFHGCRPSLFLEFSVFAEQILQINHRLSSWRRSRPRRRDKQFRTRTRDFRTYGMYFEEEYFTIRLVAVLLDCARHDRNVRNLVDVTIFLIVQSSRNRRPDNYAINQPINRFSWTRAYRDVGHHQRRSSASSQSKFAISMLAGILLLTFHEQCTAK